MRRKGIRKQGREKKQGGKRKMVQVRDKGEWEREAKRGREGELIEGAEGVKKM